MTGRNRKPLKPRKDGMCCDCGTKCVETYDRLFCMSCLREKSKRDNWWEPAAVHEQRGRKLTRMTVQTLSGAAEGTS